MIRVYLAQVRALGENKRENQRKTAQALVEEALGMKLSHLDGGAPFCENGYVSISHSGDLVAVAWSENPVGIDIEQQKERPQEVWNRALHPDEHGEGYRAWCRKEAYVKFLGLGFTAPPSTVVPREVWFDCAEFRGFQLAVCAKREDEVTYLWEEKPHVWETALLHR